MFCLSELSLLVMHISSGVVKGSSSVAVVLNWRQVAVDHNSCFQQFLEIARGILSRLYIFNQILAHLTLYTNS